MLYLSFLIALTATSPAPQTLSSPLVLQEQNEAAVEDDTPDDLPSMVPS